MLSAVSYQRSTQDKNNYDAALANRQGTMTSSRERILNKLRDAKRPFPDAPPRPKSYLPVTEIDDATPDGLFARFKTVLESIGGHAHSVAGDGEVRAKVLELLSQHNVDHVLAWEFRYIPVDGL